MTMTMNMHTNMTMAIPMTAKHTPILTGIPMPMAMSTTTAMGQMMQAMITRRSTAATTMIIPDMIRSPTPIPMIDQG